MVIIGKEETLKDKIIIMEIKLYKLNLNSREKKLSPYTLTIEGRQITYFNIHKEHTKSIVETKFYTFERDNKYKHRFKNLKLNYRFMINGNDEWEDDSIAFLQGYVRLNFYQIVKLNWIHNKSWIQKPENIKWLISIPISIFTAYVTSKLTS